MSVFTDKEFAYLHDKPRLARIATVGADGTPHVVPVGWSYNPDQETIEVRGFDLTNTKKYRDVERSKRAAIVIDELASVDPWRVRGIEIRGHGEAVREPEPRIRIHPERVISWGIESDETGKRNARTIKRAGRSRLEP